MTVLPCECSHLGECIEKTGGEQGASAEDWEITRLRNLLRAAEYAAAEAQRELENVRAMHRQAVARAEQAEALYDVSCLELAKLNGGQQ